MKLRLILCNALIFSSLIIATGCGSDGGSGSSAATSNQNPVEERQDDQGIYRVVFSPMNPDFAGEASGTMEIKIQGDDVVVEGALANAQSGVKHLQNIMVGTSCPENSSDVNQDSVIDINEAFAVSGKVFLPLDSDLSEQISGMDFGPIANTYGNYVYKRSTTLSQLLSDLRMPDPDVLDYVLKLAPENDLNLAGKVILIMGLSTATALPESVKGAGLLSAHQSLPIACGKIVRVKEEGQIQ